MTIHAPEDAVIIINGRNVTPDSPLRRRPRGPLAEIAINVPYQQNLNLRTTAGDIMIDRLEGKFTAHTSSGDIEADDIDGSVDVETSSGSIHLQHASGPVTAGASSGSIHLYSVAGPIQAKSSSGNIRIGETGATVAARASSGSIQIGSASGALHASTSSGSIEVSLSGQVESNSEMRASSGNVTVYLPDDFQADVSANTSQRANNVRFLRSCPGQFSRKKKPRKSVERRRTGTGPTNIQRFYPHTPLGRLEPVSNFSHCTFLPLLLFCNMLDRPWPVTEDSIDVG